MKKLSVKEQRHTNRVLRVLSNAVRDLEKLADQAIEFETYPRTTQKAFSGVYRVYCDTRLRVGTGNADAI